MFVRPLSARMSRRFISSANKRAPWIHTDTSPIRNEFAPGELSADFVPYAPPEPFTPKVRLIAHYLPQFHPFEENDQWWGKGFTEWSNVGKSVPNFPGHHQPHCPIHLGYYDLRVPEVMVEQAKIAKEFGVGGFSYYFYWFNGQILMERPLQQMLQNPDVDISFCLTWANESWTRRWAGRADDVLMEQSYSMEDSAKLLRHMRQYMDDPRYIRVDGKPVFIVYRANVIPRIHSITKAWRAQAEEFGWPGLYLIAAQSFSVGNPEKLGFDAAMEFPPHQIERKEVTDTIPLLNPDFTGVILDYEAVVEAALTKPEPDYKLFRSAMLSWDNTARNQNAPRIMTNFSTGAYGRWLSHLCQSCLQQGKYQADEKIVFINAWNEWAEGTHLEPDRRYGFAYLQETSKALPKQIE